MGIKTMKKGGVALLWRKSLANCIIPLELNDDRIIGFQLHISPFDYIFIFQVYLDYHVLIIAMMCIRNFISKLYDLYCIYSERGTPKFMGDFNADITGLKGRKGDVDLIGVLQDCNLRAVNTLNLSYGSFSVKRKGRTFSKPY